MKKFLTAGMAIASFWSFFNAPVLAADMATKAPPPAYSWTGCYLGGNGGGGWKHVNSSNSSVITEPGLGPAAAIGYVEVDRTFDGLVGGGQVGCDYQSNNNWIVGVQAMLDASSVSGTAPFNCCAANGDTFVDKAKSFGTVTAEIGYLINPTLKLYGKAGYGWVKESSTYNCTGAGFDPCRVPGAVGSVSNRRGGFDSGLGLAWMLRPHWDVFVEYDRIWLGTESVTYSLVGAGCPPCIVSQNQKETFDKVLIGIDYRLSWDGPAARD